MSVGLKWPLILLGLPSSSHLTDEENGEERGEGCAACGLWEPGADCFCRAVKAMSTLLQEQRCRATPQSIHGLPLCCGRCTCREQGKLDLCLLLPLLPPSPLMVQHSHFDGYLKGQGSDCAYPALLPRKFFIKIQPFLSVGVTFYVETGEQCPGG